MDLVHFDTSSYPFVKIIFTGIEVEDEVLEHFFRHSWLLLQRPEPIYIIYDINRVKYMSTEGCEQIADWMRQHQQLFKDKIKAIAYVNKSIVARVLLSQIYKNYNLSIMWQSFDTIQAAQKWLLEISKSDQLN